MTITVLDTYPAIREILRSPLADRPILLRAMLEPVAGMYRYFPGEVDLVAMHRMGSGFPLDRDEERCREALEVLYDADACGPDRARARRRPRRAARGDPRHRGAGHHRARRPR